MKELTWEKNQRLTSEFWAYVRAKRPAAYVVLHQNQKDLGDPVWLHVGPHRFTLRFPGIGATCGFDRLIDTDDAALILDGDETAARKFVQPIQAAKEAAKAE